MKTWLLTLVAVMALGASDVRADTAAEMLEKGIYNEETVGNLNEAIKIYRQVLDAAGETKRIAAQAQYRIGQCLLKQGKQREAYAAFRALIADYSEHAELVAKAKQQLPSGIKLLPAPWKSGERLTLTMRFGGGRIIGLVGAAVEADRAGDQDVWRMSVRRFVAAGQNEGLSRVVVDQATNRPLRTEWDHTVLGTASADWHAEKIVIRSEPPAGAPEEKTVEFTGDAYANDQWFYGFRQLPLKIGYEVTIPIRVAFTGGNAIGMEISVSKKETISTPVGEFDCFRLDTNIQQTFWIADVPQRYLARFDANGVSAVLSSISSSDASTPLTNESLGLSLTAPAGWFFHELDTTNEATSGGFRLVTPEMGSVLVRLRDRGLLGADERRSLAAWVDGQIAGGKRVFEGAEIRSGTMQDTQLAGIPARSFVSDLQLSGRAYAHSVTLALSDSRALEFVGSAPRQLLDDSEALLDSIRDSVRVR